MNKKENKEIKTVLVTGGAGYLGSVMVRRLLELGYKVSTFDKLYFGDEPIRDLLRNNNLKLIRGDIVSFENHPELFEGIDAVIHLAGLANDPSCDLNPRSSIEVNYRSAVRLATACKERGISPFIFASSCSVYGAGGDNLLHEQSELHPLSLYAQTKLWAENGIRKLADDSFCPVLLRQATLFGLSPRMRFDLAINMMTKFALVTKKIFVMGGGKQWRPFLHLSDACEAFMRCLEADPDKIRGETFNVGSNDLNYQVCDLGRLVTECVSDNVELEGIPEDADRRSYRVDFSKVKETLGFKPKRNVRDGVEEMAEAIRNGLLGDLEDAKYYNIRLLDKLSNKVAIEGGEPVRIKFLPFSLPLIGEKEENEVIDTLRSGWLTTGPKTKRFEENFKNYIGARYAVALNSCTAGLHLSLVALDIGEGDEVITTPVTFAATANVILHQRAKPVFVDIDPGTLNIDVSKIEEKITDKTKAIIPVHMAGQPCEMDEIIKIAEERNLLVIEDAAHAVGAEYNSRKIGTLSKLVAFSFYPIKNITTGEGGMLTTDDKELADKIRILSLHGLTKDAWKRYSEEMGEHWQIIYPGYKYNMSDIQASLGLHQLDKLEEFIEIRKRYSQIYDEAFAPMPEITLLRAIHNIKHAHHLYIILLKLEELRMTRDTFMKALHKENIGTGIHFQSIHLQPFYKERFKFKREDYPQAASISERIISLPLYPKMTEEDIEDVIHAVKKVAGSYSRK